MPAILLVGVTFGLTHGLLEALVVWHITYSAAGPVGGTGTLPARTTDTSAPYPVSESRAFLVGGGGQ